MADFSKEFLERTIAVWQPRYDRFLTLEDAREIAENMTRLFKLLGTERKIKAVSQNFGHEQIATSRKNNRQ